MPHIDIAALRYLITRHAQQRMGLRKITHEDLKYVITAGDVVEQYPDNEPDPKGAVHGAWQWRQWRAPFRVLCI